MMTDEEFREALLSSRQGNNKDREKIIKSNISLVYSIARRFVRPDCELDDLIQVGSIGLIKAIDNFDLNYKVKFSTYAVPMIMGEIRCYLRDYGLVKVSRSLKELGIRIIKEKERLSQLLGREPRISEITSSLDLTREEIVLALEATQPLASLEQPQKSEEEDYCLLDKLSSQENDNTWLNKMVLRNCLKSLSDREKKLVSFRFIHNYTQQETAKFLGISQVQISRLEKKIINRIKAELA